MLCVAPRPLTFDQFGLVERVDSLGQRVVVTVADAADRGSRVELREAFGVGHGCVLTAGIGVRNHPVEQIRAA